MSIDTVTLRCFISVAEMGGFTKAGERVGRTQSAISQQMTKLENLLRKALFFKRKTFALTPEGEVRFGLPENFATVYRSEVLAEFSRIHPRILLNIECDLTLNLFERFKKKQLDLVLLKMNRPEAFVLKKLKK